MGDFFVSSTDLKTLLKCGAPLLILDVRRRAAGFDAVPIGQNTTAGS